VPAREEIWKRKLARFPPVPAGEPSEIAQRLIELAPDAIDVVTPRHGETFRYLACRSLACAA